MKNKLSTEDFQKLQEVKKRASDLAANLGDLSYQKLSIELEIEKQKEFLKDHKIEELEFFDYLRANYINGVLNMETGDIT